jgi:hypothetical protein
MRLALRVSAPDVSGHAGRSFPLLEMRSRGSTHRHRSLTGSPTRPGSGRYREPVSAPLSLGRLSLAGSPTRPGSGRYREPSRMRPTRIRRGGETVVIARLRHDSQEQVHRRGRGPVPARRLERERIQVRLRCRADGVVLVVFEHSARFALARTLNEQCTPSRVQRTTQRVSLSGATQHVYREGGSLLHDSRTERLGRFGVCC